MDKKPASTTPESTPDNADAVALLKQQLASLDQIAERYYAEVQHQEREWVFLTEAIVAKAFGQDGPQYKRLFSTRSLGTEDVQVRYTNLEHERLQQNFEERSRRRKAIVKELIAELEIRGHVGG
jgi:hypothetical protein